MKKYATEITKHNDALAGLNYPSPWQEYARKNFGFLADGIEDIGEFSLGPLDMIQIWSYANDICYKPRYNLAEIISIAYSKYDNCLEVWKRLPRKFLERGAPKNLMDDIP